jgi:hypothetical protein
VSSETICQLQRSVADAAAKGSRPAAEPDELGIRLLILREATEAATPGDREDHATYQRDQRDDSSDQQQCARQRAEEWSRRKATRHIADIQELVDLFRSELAGVGCLP